MSFADVNGVSIHYRDEGQGSIAVVLLHEMGGSLDSWDGVVPALTGTYRVVRYDARGFGRSEKVRGDYGLDTTLGDLEALLNHLEVTGPLALVAVAAASSTVMSFAGQHPDQVTHLVLCNPAVGVSPARAAQREERAALAESRGMRAALPFTLERSYPEGSAPDAEEYARYRGRYLANDPYCFAQINRAIPGVDPAALVAKIACPIMVVAGRSDQVRPFATSEQFARTIPNSRFEPIDSGHMMPSQAPVALADLLVDFLGDTASGRTSSSQ